MSYCSVVVVLVLVGLTKKRFGHYAILIILSLRSQERITVKVSFPVASVEIENKLTNSIGS